MTDSGRIDPFADIISLVAGPIVDRFATADGHTWTDIWVVPAIIAGVVLVLFLMGRL